MSDVMQMVPVRLAPQTVGQIDALVTVLGGNRSEFVRMAVDERLERMAPVLKLLAERETVSLEGEPAV